MKKFSLGWTIITLLSLLPIVFWILMLPLANRFSSFATTMLSLGQLTALVGTVLLGITFLLNTRLRFLEKLFGGLDKVYFAHHLLGTISFLLLLFHPLFLALKFVVVSASSALSFLLPGSSFEINFGIFSLLTMILALLFTFLIKLKYQKWRFTHQLLGVSLLLAIVHIFFINSDISRSLILRVYILLFVAIGLLSFLYRTVLRRWVVKTYQYQVKEIKLLGDVTIVKLESDEGITFFPGQFIFVSFPSLSGEFHPFTIASSSQEKDLTIAIKSLGDYTQKISNLKLGDKALVEGPYGGFHSLAQKQIWIAGGIGVTPFLSMAKSLQNNHVKMYYCAKTKGEAVFLQDLEKIAKQNKHFEVISFCSSEKGRINAEVLKDEVKDMGNKEILICGPKVMMDSLKQGFKKLGVGEEKILMEEFELL